MEVAEFMDAITASAKVLGALQLSTSDEPFDHEKKHLVVSVNHMKLFQGFLRWMLCGGGLKKHGASVTPGIEWNRIDWYLMPRPIVAILQIGS